MTTRQDPAPAPPGGVPGDDAEQDAVFESLLTHVHETRAFDFTGYKRASLKRRVRHRMSQVGTTTYADYLDHLQVSPDEFAALFDTVLINVTGFFRDPDTWDHLRETALPAMVVGLADDAPLRVWSVGCASGEEAYSLAITLCEVLGPDAFRARVKIYATDVDEDALTTARQATYHERDMRGVDADLRDRYFEAQGDQWTFRKDLRRSVIFGRNDLVQDAPISRIDLLVCRNTLMYFTPPTQAAILARFRFALAPTGILVLGRAEMLLGNGRAFEAVDLRRRTFRKSPVAAHPPVGTTTHTPRRQAPPGGLDELRDHAADQVPVAQIVLDDDDVLTLANRRSEELVGVGPRDVGRLLRDLDVSYRPAELRSVVERVRADRTPQRITDVEADGPDGARLRLEILVAPLLDANQALLGVSVVFLDVTDTHRLTTELDHARHQLEASYEDLRSTSEELETTNEELQSTVEELETTNEELQSTNEELETMNEELRSTNDELQRINDDVRDHNDEIDRLNDFLESILTSLHSAVVVLDPAMRVVVWNAGAEELWGLRRAEVVGEHLLALDTGLPVETLLPALRGTPGGTTTEQVVAAVNRRGRSVEVRVTSTPLRRADGTVGGAVLIME